MEDISSMLEKDIVKQIKVYLNKQKETMVWKTHGGPFSVPGVPDLVGVYKGRFLGIEVKQPGKKATAIQELFISKLKKAGGIAFVSTSVDDVKRELENEEDSGGKYLR
jgi:penicillin-binding protein-related factor A (putative recombinase)